MQIPDFTTQRLRVTAWRGILSDPDRRAALKRLS